MNRLERLYHIHETLRDARYPVPLRRLVEVMEVTDGAARKDIRYLRDHFRAPIEYDKHRNGYYYDPKADAFELPGLWFTAAELHALLVCQQMLEGLKFDAIEDLMKPLKARIRELLKAAGQGNTDISAYVKVQPIHYRRVNSATFQVVTNALMAGRQVTFDYQARSKAETKARRVSPQRLLYYRDNWYLLSWCHRSGALRLFSLDKIRHPESQARLALQCSDDELEQHTASGFGIFLGPAHKRAHLRFNASAAQWVADEYWHPDQQGEWRGEHYHLTVPYANPTELIKEILRHGADVEVVEPEELRDAVAEQLRAAARQY